MCVCCTRDRAGQDLSERQISSRNGQFPQRATEPGREPGDGMQTAVIGRGRCHSVQEDERTALSGGRKSDRGVVLVGAGGVTGYRDQFRAHPASLHEPFTSLAKGGNRPGAGLDQQVRRLFCGESPTPVNGGGASCHRSRWTSNRPRARASCMRHGNLPGRSSAMFTPSCGGSGVARPLPTGTGRVGSRTGTTCELTVRHPGPWGHDQECEHRCRKCGLGAKAGSRSRVEPPGTRRTHRRRRTLRTPLDAVVPLTYAVG